MLGCISVSLDLVRNDGTITAEKYCQILKDHAVENIFSAISLCFAGTRLKPKKYRGAIDLYTSFVNLSLILVICEKEKINTQNNSSKNPTKGLIFTIKY